ncbi:MAG: hypothetical protein SGJ27_04845 [Candidatus Melainabacteria bacterium]|nr:hypothetical protein [Candidatus Melainabacteria bacterium]
MKELSQQVAMRQESRTAERANPTPVDLLGEGLYSAAYQGVQSPLISLGQIGDKLLSSDDKKTQIADALTYLAPPEVEEFGTQRWHAQMIGGGAGMILPFFATKSALSTSGLSFAAKTEATVFASSKLASTANAGLIADGAMTGFTYDFFLRPVEAKDNGRFWTARTEHGVAGAATFGTLTAGSVGLRHASRSMAASLVESPKVARVAYDAAMGALPGIPAGIVNAEVSSKLSTGKWATKEEITQGAYTMFVAGGVLSAAHTLQGSDVPLGEIARAYQSRKAAAGNLEAMLAERASAAKTAPSDAPVRGDAVVRNSETSTVSGDTKLTGRGSSDHSTLAVADGLLKPGRAMASKDVENIAQPTEVKLVVPKEHVETLRIGVDLAFKASDVDCTPRQVMEFFKFARGEGAPLKQSMLEVAKQYASEDPRMMTLIREAYMPPEGIENRVVQGDITLKTGDATNEQFMRWGQFMQIVREMPQDTDGYIRFRHDVFRWLNENRDLHDWAQQYGEQNKYSKIAGPLDYYFGTSNLSRFVAADAPAVTPVTQPAGTKSVADSEPAFKPQPAVGTPEYRALFDVDALPTIPVHKAIPDAPSFPLPPSMRNAAGEAPLARTEVNRPEPPVSISEIAAQPTIEKPAPPRPRAFDIDMAGFEHGGPSKRRIIANSVSEHIGIMTTSEFAKWLDYVYAKPEGSNTPGAMNIGQMFIKQKAALAQPDVVESYLRYRGLEVAPREGAHEIPLEQIRRFLGSPPKTPVGEMPEWMQQYVESRLGQASQSAAPGATPHAIFTDAVPRWLAENIKAKYVTPGRWEGNAPSYSPLLPKVIAESMEAARRTEPPPQPQKGPPKKEFREPVNDFNMRMERLNEVAKIDDPVIRDRLFELGSQDHANLRNIVQKLDPAKGSPEYKELMRLILPEATKLSDVKMLLDAIFFGNKAHRNDAGSQQTKANTQLAMALSEHIVPQSNENFGRVNQIIGDMITGKIRDPRPPMDGKGGPRGGNGGQRGDGQRGDGQRRDEGGSRMGGAPRQFMSSAVSAAVSPVVGLPEGRGNRAIVEAEIAQKAAKAASAEIDAARELQMIASRNALALAMQIANTHEVQLQAARARVVRDPYLESHLQAPVAPKPSTSSAPRSSQRLF